MYQLTKEQSIHRLSDGAYIPVDEGNRDYREYLEWVMAGNVPLPYVEPSVPVPQVISRFQALAALYQAGLLEQVETLIEQGDVMAKLAYTNAQEFHRDSPLLNTLAQALGLTEEQLDQLFKDAVTIKA